MLAAPSLSQLEISKKQQTCQHDEHKLILQNVFFLVVTWLMSLIYFSAHWLLQNTRGCQWGAKNHNTIMWGLRAVFWLNCCTTLNAFLCEIYSSVLNLPGRGDKNKKPSQALTYHEVLWMVSLVSTHLFGFWNVCQERKRFVINKLTGNIFMLMHRPLTS